MRIIFVLLGVGAMTLASTALVGQGSRAQASTLRLTNPRRIRSVAGNAAVQLDLVTVRGLSDAEATDRWGGSESQTVPPPEVVRSMSVTYGSRRIRFPRSAFSDLADVNKLELKKSAKGLTIRIVGGDAASSYRAFFEIRGGELVRRRVESGEFPGEQHEETTYTNLTPPD